MDDQKRQSLMRKLLLILLTAILSGVAVWFLPWWMIAVIPFLIAVVAKTKGGEGFFIGFVAIILLWGIWILIADIGNEHILSTRLATSFGLPTYVFIIVNILLGGIIGGLGGWSGASIRKVFKSNN